MREEEPHAVADQVRGGEVPAHEQRLQIDAQFLVVEFAAVRLRLNHVADQVVLRLPAAVFHELLEVGVHLLRAGLKEGLLFRGAHGIQTEDEPLGPLAEFGQTAFVHAEDVGDDQDRDGHGDVLHQIEPAFGGSGFDDAVDERLDLAFHLLDALIKGLHERPAIAGVVRVVHEQDA